MSAPLPYDEVPPWAASAITAHTSPDEVAPRLADALRDLLLRAFPTSAMSVREGGGTVVVRWRGGTSEQEVVAAAGLGFVYEDRGGAWIATIDHADPRDWPEDGLVSIVLRRDQPS